MNDRRIKLAILAVGFVLFDGLASGCGSGDDTGLSCRNDSLPRDTPVANPIFVTDQTNNRLIRFDNFEGANAQPQPGLLGGPIFNDVSSICLGPDGKIYAADRSHNYIVRMDDMLGSGLEILGSQGSGTNQFQQPGNIFVDWNGRIYVADTENNRVVRMDNIDGDNWITVTNLDNGNDRFRRPNDVCVDSIGRVYVVDQGETGQGRLLRLDAFPPTRVDRQSAQDIPYVSGVSIDSRGRIHIAGGWKVAPQVDRFGVIRIDDWAGNGRVETIVDSIGPMPTDVLAAPDGRVYLIADPSFSGGPVLVRRIDEVGRPGDVQDYASSPQSAADRPTGIAVASDGSIYISEPKRITRMTDMDGANLTAISRAVVSPFNSPGGVFYRSEQVFLADTERHRIVKTYFNGSPIGEVGSLGSGERQFNRPLGIFVTEGFTIYIADSGNNRIVRTTIGSQSSDGDRWESFGTLGSGELQFNRPSAVWVDVFDRIYVADTLNHRIVRFNDMAGTEWAALGALGSGERRFNSPSGLSLNGHGQIYVSDTGNHRIVRVEDIGGNGWKSKGSGQPGSAPGEFNSPKNLIVARNGEVLIADSGNKRIARIRDIDDTQWSELRLDTGATRFENPFAVFIEPQQGRSQGHFSLELNPQQFTLQRGGSAATFEITARANTTLYENISLAVLGAPPGLNVVGPNPRVVKIEFPNNRSAVQVTALPDMPAQTVELIVTGESQGLTVRQKVAVTVTSDGGQPDIQLELIRGADLPGTVFNLDEFDVIVRSVNGFKGTVWFDAVEVPAGVRVELPPDAVFGPTGPEWIIGTFKLFRQAGALPARFTMLLRATSGTLRRTVPVTVLVLE